MKPRYLLLFWEFPQLVLAAIFYISLRPKINYRLDYRDAVVYFVRGFPGGISLSWIIFINENDAGNINKVRHEYGHTLQSLYLGWFYLFAVGVPSIIRASIWKKYKFESSKYYEGYPENWADRLGGASMLMIAILIAALLSMLIPGMSKCHFFL